MRFGSRDGPFIAVSKRSIEKAFRSISFSCAGRGGGGSARNAHASAEPARATRTRHASHGRGLRRGLRTIGILDWWHSISSANWLTECSVACIA